MSRARLVGGRLELRELGDEWEVILSTGFDCSSLGIFGSRAQAECFIADLCSEAM